MSAEEFEFMLWIETANKSWSLHHHGRKREAVEAEIGKVPADFRWRFVAMHEGILAESLRTEPGQ